MLITVDLMGVHIQDICASAINDIANKRKELYNKLLRSFSKVEFQSSLKLPNDLMSHIHVLSHEGENNTIYSEFYLYTNPVVLARNTSQFKIVDTKIKRCDQDDQIYVLSGRDELATLFARNKPFDVIWVEGTIDQILDFELSKCSNSDHYIEKRLTYLKDELRYYRLIPEHIKILSPKKLFGGQLINLNQINVNEQIPIINDSSSALVLQPDNTFAVDLRNIIGQCKLKIIDGDLYMVDWVIISSNLRLLGMLYDAGINIGIFPCLLGTSEPQQCLNIFHVDGVHSISFSRQVLTPIETYLFPPISFKA